MSIPIAITSARTPTRIRTVRVCAGEVAGRDDARPMSPHKNSQAVPCASTRTADAGYIADEPPAGPRQSGAQAIGREEQQLPIRSRITHGDKHGSHHHPPARAVEYAVAAGLQGVHGRVLRETEGRWKAQEVGGRV